MENDETTDGTGRIGTLFGGACTAIGILLAVLTGTGLIEPLAAAVAAWVAK
ncbi:MAG: hypothetical protein JNK15_03205 [Planctomycetes bacterium]|nr:hypothetical protein [Planctomycetota bacterium]